MAQAREIIVAVMNDVQAVAKRDRNEAQRFNFRGIDAVLNAVGPAFRKHGGFIVPNVLDTRTESLPSKNGGSLNVVRLTVEFGVYGTEGEPIVGVVVAEAFDSGDKATAKAMSVALRTFLLQLLALPTDEPDPDSYSYEIGTQQPVEKRDWVAEIAQLSDIEAARQLYNEARTQKAGTTVLNAIKTKVDTFAK